jgi:hypothetical protein
MGAFKIILGPRVLTGIYFITKKSTDVMINSKKLKGLNDGC